MSKPTETEPPAPAGQRSKPDPDSREARLAEALRANLRRRKAAQRTPVPEAPENDSDAAQTASEKSPDPS